MKSKRTKRGQPPTIAIINGQKIASDNSVRSKSPTNPLLEKSTREKRPAKSKRENVAGHHRRIKRARARMARATAGLAAIFEEEQPILRRLRLERDQSLSDDPGDWVARLSEGK